MRKSTNNVPVVFFTAFIWMLKGNCLLFLQPDCLPEIMFAFCD